MPAGERERGSATVLVAVTTAAVLVIVALGLQLVGAVIARHRAESAADSAALAGAAAMLTGPDAACRRAAGFAAANGAQLVGCHTDRLDVLVEVTVPAPLPLVAGSARARARAGPAKYHRQESSMTLAPPPGDGRPR